MKARFFFFLLIWMVGLSGEVFAQPATADEIKKMVEAYKKDPKGPYQQILWFCKDGSTVLPKQRCPEPGGVQRAKYKEEVIKLAKTNHIFLGQILSTTPNSDFWDAENENSRLKQYLLEKYIQSIDNGWVLRRAQYYRGAVQDEDENKWGSQFLQWVLSDDDVLNSQFYLVREACRTIPHSQETKNLQKIRLLSLQLAELNADFMDIRVKIHGQPDATDIDRVTKYRSKYQQKLSEESQKQLDQLIAELENYYKPFSLKDLAKLVEKVAPTSELKKQVVQFLQQNQSSKETLIEAVSDMMLQIRMQLAIEKPAARLAFLDLSLRLEEILFTELTSWRPTQLDGLIRQNELLAKAAAGCGYIELWEWESVKADLQFKEDGEISIQQLQKLHDAARSVIEWGTGMNRAIFGDMIKLYGDFEPLAFHFTDDRIRSSILLSLGASVSRLGDFIYNFSGLSNQVMDIDNQSHFRGLNPGYAKGELVVIDGSTDQTEVSKDKIYLFSKPPSDLKPVAGIATVSEGNMVSHVQLLARNLGIPNAVLSMQNLADLKKYSGEVVFFAVSPKGKVIMKPESQMTAEEKKLFEVKKRSEEKISIPVERIELSQTSLVNLRNVNASNSGKLCGPKAANLGQLKQLFPEHVVEGLVVPFGIFRQHMNQPMPETEGSYWDFLNATFKIANERLDRGIEKKDVDEYVLARLEQLREGIKRMELLPAFQQDIKTQFIQVFQKPIGQVPVFLRSDTNMEDLKDFTGAGLNLTLFNVVDEAKILQGIKDVWASPYSERSYKWRQSYLLNPENVYPSILIIPSVDVNYSGVMITTGVQSGNADELTIAFSRGAGGAVDGQAAESYVLLPNREKRLISPARETGYNSLPTTGGTMKVKTAFEEPILTTDNIEEIRLIARELSQKMKEAPGVNGQGPWDVELGFKDDHLWLFQVRPFVENKRARSSEYLQSISENEDTSKTVTLTSAIQ